MGVGVGDAVVVQFGSSRYYTGIVWSITHEKPEYPRIKPILRRLYSTPIINSQAQRLWEWVADYYMCHLGEVMRVALPSLAKPSASSLGDLEEQVLQPRQERYIALAHELQNEEALAEYAERNARRAPRRVEILDTIASLAMARHADDGYVPRRLIDADASQLLTLRNKGLISEQLRKCETCKCEATDEFLLPTLSPAQEYSLDAIRTGHKQGKVALLHGITGSGKTEIYIHLMAEALAQGRDVMMLVPEIVITSQLIERLERIFEGRTTTYHSRLTPQRRGQTYLRLAASSGGELIVGVRSALFLPMSNPGLIIVDEEHDPSYKQSDMQPRYNARDMAVVMGSIYGAKVVLGSATPSLESYMNGMRGKYCYVELNERWGEAVLPEIVVSDTLRAVKRGERKVHFNIDLLSAMEQSLKGGKQVILFQNRRGYAPYMQCKSCGYTPRCPHCNVTLTQHKASSRLECHYCGYNIEHTHFCPSCKSGDIASMGFGTEKVVEEVSRLFPEARIARLDADSSASERSFKQIVSNFQEHSTDILVGTQILTKGFDFEGVTTVGILNADNLLSTPDFRASERAFQLMMQVAGRAGRRSERGRVVIQTSQPKHPVISQVATGDYHAMAQAELAERKTFGYPPYSHLVRLTLRCKEYDTLHRASHHCVAIMRRKFGPRVMGPVSATREMIRGEHFSEILLKIEAGASMRRARNLLHDVMTAMREAKEYRSVIVTIDVDAW